MEGKKLYVGNLNYSVTNEELEELFSDYGEIVSVNVIGGKGFGFVEMASVEEAEKVKNELDESTFRGRALRVNEANPPTSTARRGPAGDSQGAEPRDDEWSDLSEEDMKTRLREIVLEASLKETGFGARRFYFVTRENRIPFIDISEELCGRLEKGMAAIVEVPDQDAEEYTVVPRGLAQRIRSVDPEAVRFLNPVFVPDPNRRRPPR
jgi:RNA recognition motif-containing protein